MRSRTARVDAALDRDINAVGLVVSPAEVIRHDAVGAVARGGDAVTVPGRKDDVPIAVVIAPHAVGKRAFGSDRAAPGGDVHVTSASMPAVDALGEGEAAQIQLRALGRHVDIVDIDADVAVAPGCVLVQSVDSVCQITMRRDGTAVYVDVDVPGAAVVAGDTEIPLPIRTLHRFDVGIDDVDIDISRASGCGLGPVLGPDTTRGLTCRDS